MTKTLELRINVVESFVFDGMIFKLPWPILELTELESKLKLRLTILYHNFLGVSQSANMFTVSVLLSSKILYRYYKAYLQFRLICDKLVIYVEYR
jgi:hypothetical protein